MKGPVKLYLYRKRQTGGGQAAKPVLFLVHGSTFSSRGSYDLVVPGRTGYSAMDHFASLGYDVWTMDHEGYGFSSAPAATRASRWRGRPEGRPAGGRAGHREQVGAHVREISGAIRAGAFAVAEPKRVERLILHAFTYTGENAPEIERRRKQAESLPGQPSPSLRHRAGAEHFRPRRRRQGRSGTGQGAGRLRAEIRRQRAERHLSRHGGQHADGRSRRASPARSAWCVPSTTATPATRSCSASSARSRRGTSRSSSCRG